MSANSNQIAAPREVTDEEVESITSERLGEAERFLSPERSGELLASRDVESWRSSSRVRQKRQRSTKGCGWRSSVAVSRMWATGRTTITWAATRRSSRFTR